MGTTQERVAYLTVVNLYRGVRSTILLFAVATVWLCNAGAALAQLRGHGGPVRAIAVSPDGVHVLTGSFDGSAILWSLASNKAEAVLRFHNGAVNAVAFMLDGRLVTAGEDARVAIWRTGADKPERVLEGHTGPIVSLAVSPDGQRLASAAWDHTARLWSLHDGTSGVLEGHPQNVNGVAFLPDGRGVVTAGYDATLRIWLVAQGTSPTIVAMPAPLNSISVAGDGEIVAGAANGKVYFVSATGERGGEIAGADGPITALALSPDTKKVAVADIRGGLSIIDRDRHAIVGAMAGSGPPLWSAIFLPDDSLLTGGGDRMVRHWYVKSDNLIEAVTPGQQDDQFAPFGDNPGAQVFRSVPRATP